MGFGWLKRLLPRGLYGRAALILFLPVLLLQLTISVAFIQRHYEGVTSQMTRNVLLELGFVLGEIAAAPDLPAAQEVAARYGPALGLEVRLPAEEAPETGRDLFDISGLTVIETFGERLPGFAGVDLTEGRDVRLWVETPHGIASVDFDRRRLSATNPHQVLVNLIGTGLVLLFIAAIFLRNQLRPIQRLSAAAEAFGRGQSVRYRPSGATEVRAAGRAFLEMRARIERQIEQRTLLLSGISHDLRTPLTRFRLGLSLLDEEEAAPLKRDVEEMERMLDEFLSFARGEAAEAPESADPVALAREAVEDAARDGARVRLVAGEAGTSVELRRSAVRRALDNLIGNALRYAGRAEVSVDVLDRAVRFTVEDDGPGIPPEMREEALKPFARLDPARNQDRGSGVGLGLAIAADVARAHGGTLRLGDSDRLGGLRADLVLAR